MNLGCLVGLLAVLAALCGWLGALGFLTLQYTAREVTLPGAGLGLFLVTLCYALPLGSAGVFLWFRGRQEERQQQRARLERELLNMVLAQGKVTFADVAITLNLTREQVEALVRSLIGKNLFSGAVHWQQGVLYSRQAVQLLTERQCPNCGGQLEIAGQGMLVCPWCGAEVFWQPASSPQDSSTFDGQ